jgi:hypothetical protein
VLVVCGREPGPLEVSCRTIEQMRLMNALCRFVEVADERSTALLKDT